MALDQTNKRRKLARRLLGLADCLRQVVDQSGPLLAEIAQAGTFVDSDLTDDLSHVIPADITLLQTRCSDVTTYLNASGRMDVVRKAGYGN